jgi:hypothetical protein
MQNIDLIDMFIKESIDYELINMDQLISLNSTDNMDINNPEYVNFLIVRTYNLLTTMETGIEIYNDRATEIELIDKKNKTDFKNNKMAKTVRDAINSNDTDKMNECFLSILSPYKIMNNLLHYELRFYYPLNKVSLYESNKDEISKMIKCELDRFHLLGINYFESKEWDINLNSTPIIRVPENFIILTNTVNEEVSKDGDKNGLDVHITMLSEYIKRFLNNRVKIYIKPDRKMHFDWVIVVIKKLID